jgi:hypothetical protein
MFREDLIKAVNRVTHSIADYPLKGIVIKSREEECKRAVRQLFRAAKLDKPTDEEIEACLPW